MGGKLLKSEATFSFHLDGESSIDALLLSKTIADMAELTKAVALEEDNEAFFKMNVTTFKNGSFDIIFQAVCEVKKTLLLHHEEIKLASSVIGGVVGIFKIKKFLKGESPSSTKKIGQKIQIKNNSGDVILVPNSSASVINNNHIDNLVVNITMAAQQNNPNGGFTVGNETNHVKCEASDIKAMVMPFPITEETTATIKRQTIVTDLPVKKSVLMGHSKWSFMFNKKTIEAVIDDNDWLDSVQSGKTIIKAGCALHAKLKIEMELSPDGLLIDGTQRYYVTQVLKLIDNYEQTSNHQLNLFE